MDFDDVNTTLIGHPSVAILGAAIAVAESLDRPGADLLTALVAGGKTARRVAAAVGPISYVRGFHNTATIGTSGAAAAAVHPMGLNPDQRAAALALAATQAASWAAWWG
jgi:2-methylcitrate dehydratase PrpD